MTDAEILVQLELWVKDYCKNDFADGLPGGVVLFLNQGLDFMKTSSNVKSESLGDYSITFRDDFPESMLKLLKPYKRARGVGEGGRPWGMWTD
jgi:hypothetical protein